MSKQPLPAATASAICPCSTMIQIVGRPGTEVYPGPLHHPTTPKYCEKVYGRSGKNLFGPIKNSCEVLNKLKLRGFRAPIPSTYDFSTLYTTLLHNLIKNKLVDLIIRIF